MLSQMLANTLSSASSTVLVALGFAFSYRVFPYFYFAYAFLLAVGAYLTLLFTVWLGWPLVIAAVPAVVITAFLGSTIDWVFHRPVRLRGSSSLVHLVVSLAVYSVGTALLSLAFGSETRTLRAGVQITSFSVLGANVTSLQVATAGLAGLGLLFLLAMLKCSLWGRVLRAIASDPQLATIQGIRTDVHTSVAFGVGAAFAAIAGIAVSVENDVRPDMGMMPLMMASVTVLAGGDRNLFVLIPVALLLAGTQTATGWWVGFEWKDVVAFVVLVAMMLMPRYRGAGTQRT